MTTTVHVYYYRKLSKAQNLVSILNRNLYYASVGLNDVQVYYEYDCSAYANLHRLSRDNIAALCGSVKGTLQSKYKLSSINRLLC